MIKKIEFENKVAIQNDEEIARKNKVTDEDLNEIKEVVNNNADELTNLKQRTEQAVEDINTDISNLDTNKASKAELQEATIALQAELKATRKDLECGTLEGQAEGESLYLADSSDARFREFGIGGNSKQEKREGYNKLEYPYVDTTKTTNGITFTDNGDGTVTANGTATAHAYFNLSRPSLKKGNYTLSGIPNGASTSTYFVKFGTVNCVGNQLIDISEDFTPSESYIRISSGTTVNNIVFKLMLVEGTADKEYEQYGAMPSLEFPSEVEAVGQDVNIFDKDNAVKGVMFTATDEVQNDKYFSSDYIKVKKNTDYCTNEYAPVIKAFDADKNQIGYLRNVATAGTFNTENAEYIKARNSIQFETEEQMQNAIDNAKIIEGTEINGYSPYNCGSANVTVCNKNFFDKNKTPDNYYYNSNGTKTIDGTNKFINEELPLHSSYTISYKNKINDNNNVSYVRILELDADNNLIKRTLTSNNNITISVENKTKKVIACVDAGPNAYFEDLMIEANPTATGYIVHEEQKFTMPIQSEMLEGDCFEKVNGVWKEKHTWKQKTFNGSEGSFWINRVEALVTEFAINVPDMKKERFGDGFSNKLKLIKDYAGGDVNGTIRFTNGSAIFNILNEKTGINTNDTNAVKLNALRDYLIENNIEIYYKLAEPYYLDCTEAQTKVLNKIEQTLHTYKNGTHVYSVDEISLIFNAKYTKDLNAVINNLSQQAIEGGN